VWGILRHLQDVTVVMSTGYLDEAERCDELVYLYEGRIRTRGTPHQVLSGYPYQAYRLIGDEPASTLAALRDAPWFIRSQLLEGNLVIETTAEIAQVSTALHNLGTAEVWAEPMPPSLELVFTHLTHEAHGSACRPDRSPRASR
jgi:ABC-type multidrug transport system ATPase subunit